MNDKYAELRRLAEAATPGRVYDRLPEAGGGIKYHCFGDDGSIVLQVDHKNGEFGFIGPRGEQDEAFFLKCTPATILSLLDELEACRLLLKECDQVIREDGGVYIELRAFLSGRMPAADVIAILGNAAMQEQKP